MNLVNSILPLITFIPLAGSAAILAVPGRSAGASRAAAMVFSCAAFALSVVLLAIFEPGRADFQFAVGLGWIDSPRVSFSLGVDGISLFLVLLTTLMVPVSILSAWNSVSSRVKEFHFCLLLLETGMLGAFLATDLILFFVFWELVLIPMYFIIGIWGGARRIYASVKFFIYTALGSVFMILAIIYIHSVQPDTTLFFIQQGPSFSLAEQRILFLAFALAFAIKVPMFPFHTWLPDAHVEAPTAGSVILAAILLKMGSYGFVRLAVPMFPDAAAEFLPWIAGLAVFGIIFGAMAALVQGDVKKLVAYSSVSHMGVVMLGLLSLSAAGLSGSVVQMLAHGVSTGGLFLVVGMLYERRHTRELSEYGGLAAVTPGIAAVFLIVTLSSVGMPGSAGFAGEFLSFLGAFTGPAFSTVLPWGRFLVAAGLLGMVLGAVYMLYAYQRVMFGQVTKDENKGLKDISAREIAVLVPIIAAIIWMGVHTTFFTSRIEPSAAKIAQKALVVTAQEAGRNDGR
jgi:NADH-quinone oxidoreductase subunit M